LRCRVRRAREWSSLTIASSTRPATCLNLMTRTQFNPVVRRHRTND